MEDLFAPPTQKELVARRLVINKQKKRAQLMYQFKQIMNNLLLGVCITTVFLVAACCIKYLLAR